MELHRSKDLCIYNFADGANLLEEAHSVRESPPDSSWVVGLLENTMKAVLLSLGTDTSLFISRQ